jgi:putative SOS response-associated peptidase YedK
VCGRYALWGIDLLGGRFLIVDPAIGFRSRFNIAPSTENPVIVQAEDGNHVLTMRWGLIPHWTKDLKGARKPINAKAETLPEEPMFRELLRHNRCIVPANGFYEWKKTDRKKEPYFIHIKDKALFGFAGLYDTWQNAEGQNITTYSIITIEPNELLRKIHNRMPVILKRGNENRWLLNDPLSSDEMKSLLSPYPPQEMEAYQISPKINHVEIDEKNLIRPFVSDIKFFN